MAVMDDRVVVGGHLQDGPSLSGLDAVPGVPSHLVCLGPPDDDTPVPKVVVAPTPFGGDSPRPPAQQLPLPLAGDRAGLFKDGSLAQSP